MRIAMVYSEYRYAELSVPDSFISLVLLLKVHNSVKMRVYMAYVLSMSQSFSLMVGSLSQQPV